MPRTVAANDYERKLLANIEKYGWQSNGVLGEKGKPGFSYTIGLFHSFHFPELIIFGLAPKVAHGILDLAAKAAASHNPIPLDQPSDRLINGFVCEFRKVPHSEYGNYVLSANWYYDDEEFPLYQLVWPSEEGLFPWHADATSAFRAEQPILGTSGYDA
jgi:hypothetical protein